MVPWVPDGRFPSPDALPASVRPAYEGNGISVYPEYLDDAYHKLFNFLRSAKILTPGELAAEQRGERLGVLSPYESDRRIGTPPCASPLQYDAAVVHAGDVGARVGTQLADALRGFGCRVYQAGHGGTGSGGVGGGGGGGGASGGGGGGPATTAASVSADAEAVEASRCVLLVLTWETADALRRAKSTGGDAGAGTAGSDVGHLTLLLQRAVATERAARVVVVGVEGASLGEHEVDASFAPALAGEAISLYNEYADACYVSLASLVARAHAGEGCGEGVSRRGVV